MTTNKDPIARELIGRLVNRLEIVSFYLEQGKASGCCPEISRILKDGNTEIINEIQSAGYSIEEKQNDK